MTLHDLWESLRRQTSGLGRDGSRLGVAKRGLVLRGQEAGEIIDGVLRGGHPAEVILPDVGLDGAPGIGLAGHLHHVALGGDPGIGGGRDLEAHAGARAPEAAGKVVREKEGVMAAFGCQEREGFLAAWPDGANVSLKPAAELESVKLSLIEQQTQHLFPIHFTNP